MKIERERQKSKFVKKVSIGVIVIYVLFLTSKTWYPAGGDYVEATPLFEPQKYDIYNIAIESWIYSEDQNLMEIFLSEENTGIKNQDLEYEAVERTRGDLKVSVSLAETEFTVLQIRDIRPGWREISLRVSGIEEVKEPLRFYANADSVQKVDYITPKDYKGYMEAHAKLQIENNKTIIAAKEKEIRDLQTENTQIEERIMELRAELDKQTMEEQQEATSTIGQAQSAISGNNNRIEKLEEEIGTIKEKIENLEE